MELRAGRAKLRPFVVEDREPLADVANDRRVWRNLVDRFPHPYTLADADEWILRNLGMGEPTRNFAIELDGVLVGAAGAEPLDGEKCHVADVGYWLTPSVWNRGIATEALRAVTAYAFETLGIGRLQASVFAWNPASGRVLEKCGYVLEGQFRNGVWKDGELVDELWYGLINPDFDSRPPVRPQGAARSGA